MSSISINKSIASAVLALGVAFSGQVLAVDSTPIPEAKETYKKADIDADVAATLAKFNADQPGAKEIIDAAKGVLVCPTITKGGFIFGAAGGTCALQMGGKTVDYYGYGAVKWGFLAGAQSYSMIMVFNTDAALGKFRSSKREWQIGADVSVAVGEKGKTGKLDTTNLRSAIVAFVFGEKGVMGDASIDGGRFKRIDAK